MKKQLLSIIAAAFLFGSFQQAKAQTGAALNFTGAEAVAVNETGSTLDNLGLGNFTMEAWVNMGDPAGGDGNNINSIIRKSGDYNLYLNNGVLTAEVWTGGMSSGSWQQISGTTTLPTNTWVHVAFTWNNISNTGMLYVNGVAETVSVNSNNIGASEPLQIGRSAGFNQGFIGSIDEAKIYNYDLSSCQINAGMGCELSTSKSGLVLYYQFNEGTAAGTNTVTTVADSSGQGNNGALSNNFGLNGTTSNWVAPGGVASGVSCSYIVGLVTVNSPTICAGATATLTASGSNNYTWSTSETSASISPSPTVTAIYTVTSTDSYSCTSTNTSTVTVNELPVASIIAKSMTVCAGVPDTLIANVTGGLAPYTYTWSPGGVQTVTHDTTVITPSFTATTGIKNWKVIAVDANGCTSMQDTAKVHVNALPAVTASSATICAGNSTTLTAGGTATSFTWSTDDSNNGATTNTITVSPSSNDSYTLTGIDGNNCSNTQTVSVMVNASPTVTISGTSHICAGNSSTLTVGGTATTYTWATDDASNNSTAATITVTPASNDTYTLTGSDGTCSANGVITVTVTPVPTLSVTGSTTLCVGSNIHLIGSGATSYTWSPLGVHSATLNGIASSASIGTNTINLIGAKNGCISSLPVVVTVNDTPSVSITSTTFSICSGDNVTLTAGGTATNYTWTTDDGNNGATTNTITVNPSSTDTYTLIGTNANCSSKAPATITVNSATLSITGTTTVCSGSSTDLTGNGATSYTWSTDDANNGVSTTTITVMPSSNDTYTVSGTAANGCMGTAVSTVNVNSLPTVGITASNTVICIGDAATLTVGGTATDYTWTTDDGNNGVTTNTITVSPSSNDTYTLTGTDGNGCINTDVLSVSTMTCTSGINQLAYTQLSLYPNPTNGNFTIETVSEKTIYMFDVNGKMVLSQIVNGKTIINTSNLAGGVYNVSIVSNEGVVNKRLIITK